MLNITVEQEIEALLKARARTQGMTIGFICISLKDSLEDQGVGSYRELQDAEIVNEVLSYLGGFETVESYLFSGYDGPSLTQEQEQQAKDFRLKVIDDMLAKRGVTC